MKTSKELLNVLGNISEEDIIDFVDDNCKEAFIDSYLSPGFQGWFSRIVIDEDGDIFLTGSMSNSTGLISEYEGKIKLEIVRNEEHLTFINPGATKLTLV